MGETSGTSSSFLFLIREAIGTESSLQMASSSKVIIYVKGYYHEIFGPHFFIKLILLGP
jgi:hypothetical protein